MLTFPRTYNAAAELLRRHVDAERGANVAYTDDRESLTYEALAARANRAGNALLAAGARREERVMMVMLDTVDFPAVFLGAMKAGARARPREHAAHAEGLRVHARGQPRARRRRE
jgi:acyl-coenzyme A synthetase/AMP-(fatty) acid ligase